MARFVHQYLFHIKPPFSQHFFLVFFRLIIHFIAQMAPNKLFSLLLSLFLSLFLSRDTRNNDIKQYFTVAHHKLYFTIILNQKDKKLFIQQKKRNNNAQSVFSSFVCTFVWSIYRTMGGYFT